MAQLLGVLEQGLIYAILALGVYITFKILDFPDMTVDSSFPLGAAVTALMISGGLNPLWSLPASLIAGALAGAITGVIHVRFRVGGIYKNSFISVYFGDQRVQHRKKTVMAPGEMEQVLLKKADLQNIDFDTVTVTVEAE